MVNDPMGDLITRIRNAPCVAVQGFDPGFEDARARPRCPGKTKVTSAAIRWSKSPGLPGVRDRAEVLRWRSGHPWKSSASRSLAAASMSRSRPAAREERSRHLDPVDAEGRHGRHRPRVTRTWAAKFSANTGLLRCHVVSERSPVGPRWGDGDHRRPDGEVKGPKGATRSSCRRSRGQAGRRRTDADQARSTPLAPKRCGACLAPWSNNMVVGVTKGFERSSNQRRRLPRRCRARTLQLQLGFSHDVVYRSRKASRSRAEADRDQDLAGIDKQRVGQTARDPRIPSARALQGQGRPYAGETIFRKEGKKK
jgi:large subunit ribosomal protein L6